MKHARKALGLLAVTAIAATLVFGCAAQQKSPKQLMMASDWKFHDIVDVDFVQKYATVPQPEGVMIIDTRPYKPKYSKGHIPTAVNIPDTQFDKFKDKLPEDKNSLLIYYCGGYT